MRKVLKECARCGYQPIVNSWGRVVDLHDCGLVRAIDGLVEEAAAAADRSAQFRRMTSYEWDATYHRAMNRLARERGLRKERIA